MTRYLLTAVTAIALLLATPTDAVSSVPTTGSIRGLIRAGARPVPNVTVRLQNKHRSARTNRSGRFTFNNLPPGNYTLLARTRHHGSARVSVSLRPGQSPDVVLSLRLPRRPR